MAALSRYVGDVVRQWRDSFGMPIMRREAPVMSGNEVEVREKCGDTAARVVDEIAAESAEPEPSATPIADDVTAKLLPKDLWCQHGIHYRRSGTDTYTCSDPDAVGHPKAASPPGRVPCQPLTPYDPATVSVTTQ